MREAEIEELQRSENSALRWMVHAQKWTQLAGIKEEVAISNMRSRIVKGRLQYLRIAQGENKQL